LQLSRTPRNILYADTVLGVAVAKAPKKSVRAFHRQLSEIELSLPSEDYGALSQVVRLRTRGEVLLADGLGTGALKAFEGASAHDAPVESREYMARALLKLGGSEPDRAKAKALLARALDAYSGNVRAPASAFYFISDCLPGFYADQLADYLRLAEELGSSAPALVSDKQEFVSLRGETLDVRKRFSASTINPPKE
jgi:hypothetical protein